MLVMDRLMQKIVLDSELGCWLWTGATNTTGYPTMHYNGKAQAVGRVSVELATGEPVGKDMVAVPNCIGGRACVNPEHIEVITRTESRARQKSTVQKVCPNGHAFTEANTIYRDGTRRRDCRKCRDERNVLRGFSDHCRNGHRWTPETTDHRRSGHRICLLCQADRQAAKAAEKLAAWNRVEHGTPRGWDSGCRCDACVADHNIVDELIIKAIVAGVVTPAEAGPLSEKEHEFLAKLLIKTGTIEEQDAEDRVRAVGPTQQYKRLYPYKPWPSSVRRVTAKKAEPIRPSAEAQCLTCGGAISHRDQFKRGGWVTTCSDCHIRATMDKNHSKGEGA